MSVPCAEARGLYKTVSTCYRELYQAHGCVQLASASLRGDATVRGLSVIRALRRVFGGHASENCTRAIRNVADTARIHTRCMPCAHASILCRYFYSVSSLLNACSTSQTRCLSTAEPILRHLRRVLVSADHTISSTSGAHGKAPVDGKALVCNNLLQPVQLRTAVAAVYLEELIMSLSRERIQH